MTNGSSATPARIPASSERADPCSGVTAVMDIAHRGSSGSAPENTLAAVRFAVDQGCGWVEVDVHRSADGELVVMHDVTLSRTTNVADVFPRREPWRIVDFTYPDVGALDAGSWYSSDFAGEPVPLLRDVVTALGPHTGLLLEIKHPELYPGIEMDIHKELSSIPGYLDHALGTGSLVVQSFVASSMRTYHDLAPDVPLGLLHDQYPTDQELVAARRWARQVNVNGEVVDRRLVDRIHELGMTIAVYTINTGRLMCHVIGLGVDGVITDYPRLLRDTMCGGDPAGETTTGRER